METFAAYERDGPRAGYTAIGGRSGDESGALPSRSQRRDLSDSRDGPAGNFGPRRATTSSLFGWPVEQHLGHGGDFSSLKTLRVGRQMIEHDPARVGWFDWIEARLEIRVDIDSITFRRGHAARRAPSTRRRSADCQGTPLSTETPFQHRSFRLFWLVRIASSMSFQMLAVAIGWNMYAITGSAFDLGLVGLAQFLPIVALTLLVGHVADRYDRRSIIRVCQIAMAVVAIIFVAGSSGGWLSRNIIFALVAVLGSARAFESPTTMTLLPAVVPRHVLRQATAASSSANQTAQIVGPSLGGVLYAVSPSLVYAVVTFTALGAAVALTCIRLERQDHVARRLDLASLFSGIAFVGRNPLILGALSLDLVAVLLGGATALLPIFAQDVLHTGPWGLGLLRSAPAAGALCASLVLARRPLRTDAGKTMLCGVGLFGLATITFGLSRSIPLSLLALFILGASDTVSVVVRQSLVQLRTPPEMLGRVSALNSLFVGTSNQLGEFESGATAALFGVVPAVLVGGIGTMLVAVIWAIVFPSLRNLRTLDEPSAAILDERTSATEIV